MSNYRVTIRNVDPDTADLLRRVAFDNQMTLGEAFEEAVLTWWDSLEEVDGDADTEPLAA